MGYGDQQIRDLEATIDAIPCDVVLVGTPFDLARLVRSSRPMVRVTYGLDSEATSALESVLNDFLSGARPK